jgi:phosphohistidine phosphatase
MRINPDWFYRQSAVIPYRFRDGDLEILLISNRRKSRWIVPKGVKEPHLSAADSAASEALEEAGIRGRVSSRSIGSYKYDKWGGTCTVEVFLMEVTEVLDKWLEDDRNRKWLSPKRAAGSVNEPKLKRLLLLAAEELREA